MHISKDLEIIDLAIIFKNNLIIADTHIGYEESLTKRGIFAPRFHFNDLIKRLELIFLKFKNKKYKKIIINGDIKHEFGAISEQEWRQALQLLDFLSGYCKEIIIIKGNHDQIIGPIAQKRNVKVLDSLQIGDKLIIHGDKIPGKLDKKIKTIIIAHEHPAISLKEGARIETFKCFLKGKWNGKELIVQPSFNLVTEGSDILKEEVLSPFLKGGISNFEVFIVADKIYNFGPIKRLKKI